MTKHTKINSHKAALKVEGTPGIEPAIEAVCVYCGSGPGTKPVYAQSAQVLGESLANSGIRLIYGGGGMGLMGEVARATISGGGKVTGIIPDFLSEREQMLRDVDELIVTGDMHERKRLMFERSDAFVALPGGIGTLEELVEQLTWSQLGQHQKPIILANIDGFWDPFIELLGHMKSQQFIRKGLDVSFTVVTKADDILPAILKAAATTADQPPDEATLAKF
ncbi:MAG: TIGR00730 family Rossman fold protein [Alphaproteobacteria bacterium]|nr:TIGR00730 family Rossman fold protein [Alphaproteobacteria bacterium]